MSNIRSRDWVFTVNNFHEWELEAILALECKYVVCGREVGESGTPHLQGFICFENAKTRKAVSKLIPRAWLEKRKGSFQEASAYCKKEGNFVEFGVLPLDQKAKGEVEKERWDLALKAYMDGRLSDVPVDIGVRFGKGLEFWANKLKASKVVLSDTDSRMEWYHGMSGTGKSRKAREDNPGAYLKMCNKWWDGYQGEDVVIIEDFDKKHDVLVHHLKIWLDRYPFPAEVKGGKIDIRPKKIIITSNYHPNEIWNDPSDLDPILRRVVCLRFGEIPVYPLFSPNFNPYRPQELDTATVVTDIE